MTEQSIAEYVPTNIDLLGSKRPEQVLQLKYDVAHIMDRVLTGPTKEHPSGVHYGPSFPGSNKNSLLLPGAHTLASTFGLTPTYDVVEIPEGKGRRYQVRTKMHSRAGLFLGEGIGEASTEEEKFAWQEAVCDAQYDATDMLDRRVKFKKDARVEAGYVEIKQVRTNVADKSNTALKIGKKRSFVDAVILVLDCSDIFDQDFEELGDELGFERAKGGESKEPKKKKEPLAPSFSYGKFKGHAITDRDIPVDYLQFMADATAKSLDDPAKAKFKAQNTLFLAALDAEIAFRKAKDEKPAEPPPQTPPNPSQAVPGNAQTGGAKASSVPGDPAARQPFTESGWAEFVRLWEDEWTDIYSQTKELFGVRSSHDLQADKRFAFYDQMNSAISSVSKK